MLLFTAPRGVPMGDPAGMAEMTKFSNELARQGKLRRGAPLVDEDAGARIEMRDGRTLVTDGPFAESKEVVGGFWIVDVADRDEAIDIARRTPHARTGIVEVRMVKDRHTVPDPGNGTPFLLSFRTHQGIVDADGSKKREMSSFGEILKREAKFLEAAPLAHLPPAARVAASGGKLFVTDGPFPETKEVIGGYSIVRAADRAEAIAIAERYPHAKWGPIEVREVMFFDPVA
jgi:hypothetical protein